TITGGTYRKGGDLGLTNQHLWNELRWTGRLDVGKGVQRPSLPLRMGPSVPGPSLPAPLPAPLPAAPLPKL
ncbi:MAG TPA: hypothetical protein VIV11_05655, partial [Kofleriaceae bacterium]